MSNHAPSHPPFQPTDLDAAPLSPVGLQRRGQILKDLHSQLRRRTMRRRIITTTATAAILVAVGIPTFLMLRTGNTPTPDSTIAHTHRPSAAPTPNKTDTSNRSNTSHASHPTPRLATNTTTPPAIAPPADGGTGVIIRIVSSDSLAPLNCSEPSAKSTPSTIRVCLLSDDQLLQELAAAGQDCGLIRIGNRAELTCDVLGKH